jgi:hypothetical protein
VHADLLQERGRQDAARADDHGVVLDPEFLTALVERNGIGGDFLDVRGKDDLQRSF